MAIPKKMQPTYDAIWAYLGPFCDERLNKEFEPLLVHALEKLCRKRPSPLLSGRPQTWAAGIAYAICRDNWVFDEGQPLSMTAAELADYFGVAKSTAANKAPQISKMLKIDHFNPEWRCASLLEHDSLAWMVSVDGFPVDARYLPLELQIDAAARGLIPYVPALRDE